MRQGGYCQASILCAGEEHRVALINGSLVLLDHEGDDVAATAALHHAAVAFGDNTPATSCYALRDQWISGGPSQGSQGIPSELMHNFEMAGRRRRERSWPARGDSYTPFASTKEWADSIRGWRLTTRLAYRAAERFVSPFQRQHLSSPGQWNIVISESDSCGAFVQGTAAGHKTELIVQVNPTWAQSVAAQGLAVADVASRWFVSDVTKSEGNHPVSGRAYRWVPESLSGGIWLGNPRSRVVKPVDVTFAYDDQGKVTVSPVPEWRPPKPRTRQRRRNRADS